jgi:uncharacterized protein (TIGR00730 family)
MNICVFCSAADVDEKYAKATREFGRLIAQHGHSLVWGGSYVGLMKVIADAVRDAAGTEGGKLIGVSIEKFRANAHPSADEMYFTTDLATRKALLLQKSDALVALVGGTGTLDEISEMIELKKYSKHHKPIVILNTDGFYDGLKTLFERMYREGFLYFPLDSIVRFVDQPEEALAYIERFPQK